MVNRVSDTHRDANCKPGNFEGTCRYFVHGQFADADEAEFGMGCGKLVDETKDQVDDEGLIHIARGNNCNGVGIHIKRSRASQGAM